MLSLGFEVLLPMVKYFPIVSSLLHCISRSCHKISSTDVCTFSNKENLNVIWIWYMGISHGGLFSIVDIFKKWYKSFLFLSKRVTSSICSSYPIPFLRIGASLLISYFSLSPIRQQHRSPFDGFEDFQKERRIWVIHILKIMFQNYYFLFTKLLPIP